MYKKLITVLLYSVTLRAMDSANPQAPAMEERLRSQFTQLHIGSSTGPQEHTACDLFNRFLEPGQELLPQNCSREQLTEYVHRNRLLTVLQLQNSPRLTDTALWSAVRKLRNLRVLIIESCEGLTEDGIIGALIHSNIDTVCLSNCNQVTGKLSVALLNLTKRRHDRGIEHLIKLAVTGCRLLTPSVFEQARRNFHSSHSSDTITMVAVPIAAIQ